ncbi:MAG: gamma-glutamyltransferase [Planctomycetales bacterium]|nr:gamma-glutamyltransferase [Planctomycetales bacterium]
MSLCHSAWPNTSVAWQAADAPIAVEAGAIATVQPLATEAGLGAYQRGGNAIDAAVAAALTLGVVDGHNSGIGGGCFILIHRADGTAFAIDGRETAPAAAHENMFLRDGKPQAGLSETGPLATGVPGAIAAYYRALRRHGNLSFAELLEPAAQIAENGFPLDSVSARRLASTADKLMQFSASKAIYFKPNGHPYGEGELLKQPDLAQTYRGIARQGPDYFYRGPVAQAVSEWMSKNGGMITANDFGNYEAKTRDAIVTNYRGYDVIGFPPPSSGGVHVAEMLNILEPFDLRAMHQRDPVQLLHVIAEAMKLAFADRAYWLGDADFADVPRGLIDKEYGRLLSQRINVDRATPVPEHGEPPQWKSDLFERHTTHVAAADKLGNWVAITATVNTSFGSKVVVPGTGVVLNNQMDDFSVFPGVPNFFGLVGAINNAVAPGKRPLSSMSPTIVLKDGRPVLTVGAAGGPKIITQVLLAIVRTIDLQMPLDEAIAQPRIHHQWSPDKLMVEHSMDATIIQRLKQFGHVIDVLPLHSAGVTQAIGWKSNGQLWPVHDPRIPGQASVYVP